MLEIAALPEWVNSTRFRQAEMTAKGRPTADALTHNVWSQGYSGPPRNKPNWSGMCHLQTSAGSAHQSACIRRRRSRTFSVASGVPSWNEPNHLSQGMGGSP